MKKIKCKLCKFKCLSNVTIAFVVCNSDWKRQQLGNTISIWNAWKFEYNNFGDWGDRGNHMFCKKNYRSSIQKRSFRLILVCMCMLICMCMCNVYDQHCTCMAQVSGLSCGCCPCPRPGSPSATITFLPCLPGTMLGAPLVSTSPSCRPSQCPVPPPPATCRKAQLQPPSFTLYVVHSVSEWQTILGQWPWQTAAAGHTKLNSSQLVSLSLWLNAWCERLRDFVCGEVVWFFSLIHSGCMIYYSGGFVIFLLRDCVFFLYLIFFWYYDVMSEHKLSFPTQSPTHSCLMMHLAFLCKMHLCPTGPLVETNRP